MNFDLREALNTISDVVHNRPSPIREFDQIYMRVGDMVIQSEYIARVFNNMDVVFIGDGDAISSCIMHLKEQKVIEYGPNSVHVLDFDERIVNSVNFFAQEKGLSKSLSAELYNVVDPISKTILGSKDAFYTNPPWGASNKGASVEAFVQRGIEAIKEKGWGVIIIADDSEIQWALEVLFNTQSFLIKKGFIVQEMIPGLHSYHLDDAPDLRSCTLAVKNLRKIETDQLSIPLGADKFENFYGKNNPIKYRYVRDLREFKNGQFFESSYRLEMMEKNNGKK